MNLQQIKSHVSAHGGATLTPSLDNANIKKGYMVSLNGYETITTIKELTSEALTEYKHIAEQQGGYIGLWLDDNKLYIDISIKVDNFIKALYTARMNQQLAIYHNQSGESIYLKKNETPTL